MEAGITGVAVDMKRQCNLLIDKLDMKGKVGSIMILRVGLGNWVQKGPFTLSG